MAIYVIAWIAMIMPYLVFDKRKWKNFERNYAIYAFLCLVLLIGLRHETVGADTSTYKIFYKRAAKIATSVSYEKGYYLFSAFFRLQGISFEGYNFIVASILVAVLTWFYATYSNNLAFSNLLFMTIGLLPVYMTAIRQSIAISIGMIAVMWVDKHNKPMHIFIALALVWLSTTFHVSGMICYLAVLFVALRIRLSRRSIAAILLIISAALIYRNQLVRIIQYFIPAKYRVFSLNANYQINPLLIIISILIPGFCLLFDNGEEWDGKYSCEKTWLYIFSCANVLFTILARNSMYFSRIAFYFLHFNSILVPNMIEGQKLKSNKYIMYFVIGFVCMLYFLISIPDGALHIDRYKFFWQ